MELLLPTKKLTRRSTVGKIREAIYACKSELMDEYDRSGKIGRRKPEDMNNASEIATEECYRDARRYAGDKVLSVEKLFPKAEKGR